MMADLEFIQTLKMQRGLKLILNLKEILSVVLSKSSRPSFALHNFIRKLTVKLRKLIQKPY